MLLCWCWLGFDLHVCRWLNLSNLHKVVIRHYQLVILLLKYAAAAEHLYGLLCSRYFLLFFLVFVAYATAALI